MDSLDDVALDIELVVVGEAVNFVNEDFNVDVRIVGLKVEDGHVQAANSFKILVLSIDNPNQSTDLAEDCLHIELRI